VDQTGFSRPHAPAVPTRVHSTVSGPVFVGAFAPRNEPWLRKQQEIGNEEAEEVPGKSKAF
jgi:hypothetical protein